MNNDQVHEAALVLASNLYADARQMREFDPLLSAALQKEADALLADLGVSRPNAAKLKLRREPNLGQRA
ncbi:MAG: hypothetical protein ACR2RF_29745 [Geminicoccaceae bacterium]